MKKFGITILLTIFCLSLLSINTTANNKSSDDEVLFEKEEITDLEELRELAKNGISDLEEEKEFIGKLKMVDNVTNEELAVETQDLDVDVETEELDLETYQTTQKLKTIETTEGEEINYFATTVFNDIPTELLENENEEDMQFSAAASKSEETKGASLSVRSYSTIYWDTKTSGYSTTYKLTKITGGWEILDNQVSITSKRVEYGQTYPLDDENETKYPTGSTFSYTTPSSWAYRSNGYFGGTTYATLKRGTSTWVQDLVNTKAS